MPNDPLTSLDALHALKLITRRQREQALAHPDLPQLATDATLADAMMWLYRRQIVEADDLTGLSLSVARNYSGEALEQRMAIVNQLVATLNLESLNALRDEAVITPELYQLALEHLPGEVLLPTPGEALTWMLYSGVLPHEQLKEVRQRVKASGGQDPQRIMEHLDRRVQQHKKEVRGVIFNGLFSGTSLAWLVIMPLILIGTLWYGFSSSGVPECDTAETQKAVTRMLNASETEQASKISLHDIREAGYASSQKIRGCLATVQQDGKKTDFAYTVTRDDSGSSSRIAYTGAQPLLVKTRFGSIKDGEYAQQAKPLGREALEKAFRAGMDGARIMPQPRQAFSLTQSYERRREIAEIEPLAPCREVSPGVYSCKLLIERNDVVLSMLNGGSSVMQEGDFTFQRDAAGKGWSVTPQFAGELRQAKVKE